MQNVTNAIFWAIAILIAAYLMRIADFGAAASFSVTMGLSAAALATMSNRKRCRKC